MTDVRFWVQRYLSEGWAPLPIPAGEKGPRSNSWPTEDYQVGDFHDDDNVGVKLGVTQLYDVDLDDKTAAIAADILLPPTNRVSGRPGKPRSHRFYLCSESIEHVPYYGLGGNNDTIVELRGFSKNGSPTQTVVPPSTHPSGELITWEQDGKPTKFDAKGPLETGVRNVAVATLLARHFPGPGHRHAPRLALAGFLHRAGLEDLEVLNIGRAVMTIVGGDVQDWLDTCRTTLSKLKADPDAAITGGPTLKESLDQGEQVLKRLNIWLGRQDQAQLDDMIEGYNKHYFLVTLGSNVVVGDDSHPDRLNFFTFENFKRRHIKDRQPDRITRKGALVPGRPCAEVWLEHPDGRHHDQLVFAPPPLTCNPADYNGWKGLQLEPAPGPWPRIDYHLKQVVCGGSEDHYAWFINWCAALVQHPGTHANSAILLMGGQGTGKGFVAHDLLGSLFDRRHFLKLANSQQFYHRFAGELLSGRCLLFLDEATWGGDKREAGMLKDYVTGDSFVVDRKGISAETERSMLHLIIASNEDWPIGIDKDDRRFVAFKLDGTHAKSASYFEPLYLELKSGGQAGFLHDLLQWPIDWALLRQPPVTQAKTDLKLRSQAPEAEWWQDCLNSGRVLTTDKNWPTTVVRSALTAEYLQYMQNLGVGRRLSPGRLNKRLLEFCPSMVATRHMGKPRVWQLPVLSIARQEFEQYIGGPVVWEDPDASTAHDAF